MDAERGTAPAGLGRSGGPPARLREARARADLCRLLLAQTPTVCLFVRSENTPALRLYDSIGMTRALTYRSVIF